MTRRQRLFRLHSRSCARMSLRTWNGLGGRCRSRPGDCGSVRAFRRLARRDWREPRQAGLRQEARTAPDASWAKGQRRGYVGGTRPAVLRAARLGHEWGRGALALCTHARWSADAMLEGRCPCPDSPCSRLGRVGSASAPARDGVLKNQIEEVNNEMNTHISELDGCAIPV